MATTDVYNGKLILRTPGIRGGRPYVANSGVTVRRIVSLRYVQGLTPEEIVEQMPHLTLAGVHAAVAYYHANKDSLDAEFAREVADEARVEYLGAWG
jgi:uncharacterized protein (DUF433 family)